MPISLTFLLKSLPVSLVPFEDVFCTGPEQLQPGKGEEPRGCTAALLLPDMTQSMQTAPGSAKAADAVLLLLQLPSENPDLVCHGFGICCCCLPCCLFSTCLQPSNHWQVLTRPTHVFLPFLHIISHPSAVRSPRSTGLQGT